MILDVRDSCPTPPVGGEGEICSALKPTIDLLPVSQFVTQTAEQIHVFKSSPSSQINSAIIAYERFPFITLWCLKLRLLTMKKALFSIYS